MQINRIYNGNCFNLFEQMKENETILDPCMGIGTTAISCIKNNRTFIGFELSKEYCDIAENRINEHIGNVSV